ncbi:hypothetical protein VOI54_10740 [Tamlana sp. 2201CG12-4]|uniref:hypothetical protein n=1 Tax=Tamlana sp. 2201CG12-4 TaxID=3112582 RepID=UPI002DBC0238|nr:hypothetical protein [Tamlana sp. 2201CG12-4]MEC3907497.1 hypothetical protein [Tamlana sp. 2201CG12-4]
MKILKFALLVMIFSSLFVQCTCSDELEDDNEAPVIEVLSPNDNAIFYTEDSTEVITYIIANATATDNNKIASGSVTITNVNGDIVHSHSESTFEVYTSFSTLEPGTYTVTFEFTDPNGNTSSVFRNIVCQESIDDGEGEEQAKKY